ncbi:MAG: hypothetical protein ACI8P3_002437 [Saprospiraceae bacterium]|jgi:hypothetical protein
MEKGFITAILFIFSTYTLIAQGSAIPLGTDSYHISDRLEIMSGIEAPYHSSTKPYLRGDLTRYAIQIDSTATTLTALDRKDLYYIFNDNNEWLGQSEFSTALTGAKEPAHTKVYVDSTNTFYHLKSNQPAASKRSNHYVTRDKPILKHFYKTPANFFELDQDYFHLKLNPIINFKLARAKNDDELVFQNTRGVEIRGSIDDRIYFYSNILENQSRFADYVNDRIAKDGAIPGSNLFKNYKSQVFDITNGYDYLTAQGYIGFNLTRHVGMQFGHGRNFIGNGYRSLLLSDFGSNYFYLKFNTKVWRIHFQNIFAELAALPGSRIPGDNLIPKKYLAAHYIDFKLSKNLSIGLYEAIVFSRNNQFELQYLNPIILYRTVEHYIGSPDNALLGLNAKWNLFNRFQLYGQLMLDEFKFDELFIERRGWWANKYGIQLGLKYINTFGIDHLDTQVEYNAVRPYTYTHRDSSASYSHYNQPLAHPLGANFKEYIFKIRYQPFSKFIIDSRLMFMNYGEDEANTNWGANLNISHNTREMDIGNEIGQGIGTNTVLLGIDLSYQLYHNMYIDLHYFYRKQGSDLDERDRTTSYIGGGFRMNIADRKYEF